MLTPPGFRSSLRQAEHVGSEVFQEFARWLLWRRGHAAPHQAAREVIPIDHDVMFKGSIGPTIGEPSDEPDDRAAVNEVWDQVLARPTYAAAPMTPELFNQAMRGVAGTPDGADPMFGHDPATEDIGTYVDPLPGPADEIPGQDAGMVEDPAGAATFDFGEPAGPSHDFGFGCGAEAGPGSIEGLDALLPGAGSLDNGPVSLDAGPLEQIIDELAPLAPEPEPMMEEMEDPMLMDPWMMPGMGLMPPGLGPMGPLGPMM